MNLELLCVLDLEIDYNKFNIMDGGLVNLFKNYYFLCLFILYNSFNVLNLCVDFLVWSSIIFVGLEVFGCKFIIDDIL